MIGESESRPWGSWTVLDEGERFKVKRIEVKPHARLSYQTHEHRAEHWVVAAGIASSIVDGEIVVSKVGECVDIAVGQPHRIVNNEDEPLVIIEVQRGGYLGEDDIIRLEDGSPGGYVAPASRSSRGERDRRSADIRSRRRKRW